MNINIQYAYKQKANLLRSNESYAAETWPSNNVQFHSIESERMGSYDDDGCVTMSTKLIVTMRQCSQVENRLYNCVAKCVHWVWRWQEWKIPIEFMPRIITSIEKCLSVWRTFPHFFLFLFLLLFLPLLTINFRWDKKKTTEIACELNENAI